MLIWLIVLSFISLWYIYCIIKLCDYIEFLRKAHDKEIDAIMETLKDHKESIEKIIKAISGGESWT